tara:strand:- start:289 stop:1587 length:1299 start_codon:yes stop_codon:yes gene_type:complete
MHISSSWPFKPNKFKFYYGWVIWVASAVGILCTIPGQTVGIAAFTDSLITALNISRTELSLAYLIGTIISSFYLTRAGRWFDILGARMMISTASICFSLSIIYLSFVDTIGALLGGSNFANLGAITFGFFLVRFLGQGVLTNCSRNSLLLWFNEKRGLVVGMRTVVISFGFSTAPLFLGNAIGIVGWKETLWFLALFVGVGFSALAFIFIRDNPKSCGLEMDGFISNFRISTREEVQSATLAQAKKNPIFWVYSLSFCAHAMFITAVIFHITSIFAEAGKSPVEAFSYFIPAAIFSTTTNMVTSWLSDRIGLKPLLVVMLFVFALGCFGVINVGKEWGFWLLAFGFGTGSGLWGVLTNLTFIRFFGPNHIGEISGFSASLSVFASAIGPALFSFGYDLFGSYTAPAKLSLLLIMCLLAASILINQKEPERTY